MLLKPNKIKLDLTFAKRREASWGLRLVFRAGQESLIRALIGALKFALGQLERGDEKAVVRVSPFVDWLSKSVQFGFRGIRRIYLRTVIVAEMIGRALKPRFDITTVREPRAGTGLPFFRDSGGDFIFVLTEEFRPIPLDPRRKKRPKRPWIFSYLPGGFIGEKNLSPIESLMEEVVEEVEISREAFLEPEIPNWPFQNTNPAFMESWLDLAFFPLDFNKIRPAKAPEVGDTERIKKRVFVSARKLLQLVRMGNVNGTIHRAAHVNGAFFIFLAHHHELLEQFDESWPSPDGYAFDSSGRLVPVSLAPAP